MHILMRLNLKKLPNITKPLSVPHNILENFYKNYNISPLHSESYRRHDTQSPNIMPHKSHYAYDEIKEVPTINNSDHIVANSQDTSNERFFSEMQGDDPTSFDGFQLNDNFRFEKKLHFGEQQKHHASNDHPYDEERESVLSHIRSIYIFPEKPHLRHKVDVLRFKFDTTYSEMSYVILHLYLRGMDWIRVHHPRIINQMASNPNKEIAVSVHRALRGTNSANYTHKAKIFEFRHKIPPGQGQWVNVDLKPLFLAETAMITNKTQTQDIFIKGVEPWMQPIIVTSDNNSKKSLTVHIEIGSQKKNRRKRSVFMDCTESDHDMRCCRYPLTVNFTNFGWHFVVAPTSFDAYFCSGDCRVGYLEQYPHTHLAALTTSATPCCSPTKMSSLSLLYFDDNQHLVLSVIPNMSVEGCSCS
ncbi:hypothetical protein KR222_005848 [Zaprionus bogoriensis]|nr:hypothetical protein KR222_005848 [Zaprionus bogoriensis]